jgi:hypothetical protein
VSASNAAPTPAAIFRDGKDLVVAQGAQLPLACIRCGQAATGGLLRKKFYRHERWVYFLLLPGVIWYIIAAYMVRKRMDLAIPLCAEHRIRFQWLRQAAILMMIGSTIFVIISFFLPPDYLAYAIFSFFGLLLIGLVTWLIAGQFLRPIFINQSLGIFRGANEHFLAQLPPKPPSLAALG